MVIFGEYKFLLDMTGLDPNGGRKNIVGRAIFSVTSVAMVLLLAISLLLELHGDFDRVSYIVPIFVAFVTTISTYFHLLLNRKSFYCFLDEMEDIVHESLWNDQSLRDYDHRIFEALKDDAGIFKCSGEGEREKI